MTDSYEAPALVEYGTIEEWTRQTPDDIVIDVSIIIGG